MSEYTEVRRRERDRLVLNLLPVQRIDAIAISDLVINGWRPGTIRASLNRLLASKAVERVWDGNERFGRYLYYAV